MLKAFEEIVNLFAGQVSQGHHISSCATYASEEVHKLFALTTTKPSVPTFLSLFPQTEGPYDTCVGDIQTSVHAALKARKSKHPETILALVNASVLNVDSGIVTGEQAVFVQQGRILEPQKAQDLLAEHLGVVLDCAGKILMPGLCDAHVHCTAVTADLSRLMSLPESLVATRAASILHGMLMRGFTTVRDAGGADWGLAQAVEEGTVLGPRLLFTGHALSQTGGHGDFRGKGEDMCACGAALRGIGRVCDGDAEVRKAARDELRRAAHCIKIMASGGVASPTDKLTSTQFSKGEITAIVEEAQAVGSYVCAHAYMPSAIKRAVECGVRSIEHGNWLDQECALLMKQHGSFLVPTLITYQKLLDGGEAAGMSKELVAKVGTCVDTGLEALKIAREAGVTMCFGSDLLGDLHAHQSEEFLLRARVLTPHEVLKASTVNCAELFGMQYTLGQVQSGYAADLILVDSNPIEDLSCLASEKNILAVIKEGLLVKAPTYVGAALVNAKLCW